MIGDIAIDGLILYFTVPLQVLAGISSGLGVNEVKDSVLNINLKKSTGTMPSVSRMTPASVVNTGGPERNCFVLSLPLGGWDSLGELCGWG